MQDRIIRLALIIATVLAVTTGSLAASPSEPCRPPSYQIVQTRWDQDSSEGVAKRIVIALRDFAPERLLCLVQSLERRYKRPEYVSVEIFSSLNDARTCFPDIPVPDVVFTCRQRHAEYKFNAITKQRFVHLLPMGSPSWGGEDTLVNVPATTLRPCRLELDHRCILELNYLGYPDETLAALVSGAVTVTGTVGPQGRATTIEVLKAEAHDVRGQKLADVLIRTVMENVRTWRLEELARETAFRITFEFEVTDDLSQLSLEFQLPTRIIVRGKPSLLKYRR